MENLSEEVDEIEIMTSPEFTDCNVIACAAIPATQAAIALVPAVPTLSWTATAAV